MVELRATVRLQFHAGFSLDDAVPLVDYFARLGISHIYASPLLKARPGSSHGYDVIDPTCVNPELGGEPALRRLSAALHQRDMGLIMDIVPNHMAVDSANPWWQDVLEWGAASPYAGFFDITWRSQDEFMRDRLLLPILRSDYLEVLKAGEIQLMFDAPSGRFFFTHFDHRMPLAMACYAEILQRTGTDALARIADRCAALTEEFGAHALAVQIRQDLAAIAEDESAAAIQQALQHFDPGTAEGCQRLHGLLECQHYRLASWRTANDDINWRRFFDVNELVSLRAEQPRVFEATHSKIFELVEAGIIDGLRIDHIDGLANPRAYCRRLRRRVDRLLGSEHPHFPIHVEKILAADERLPLDWMVDGTTGYEFMNRISLLQHDPNGQTDLAELWGSLSGRSIDFTEEVREARGLVLSNSLAADFEILCQALLRLARCSLRTRDLTLGAIRRALRALIVHYPVYRTYTNVCARSATDQYFFDRALAGARTELSSNDWPVLEQIDRWLGGEPLHASPPGPKRRVQQRLLSRFHQLTSPVAAKAVEDTACYRSAILLSRNDVGFDPQRFSASLDWFHSQCIEQVQRFPLGLLTTASHDHKRGEDARARLAVISEHAPWFGIQVRFWRNLAEPLRSVVHDQPAPAPADELMLYQTLFSSWPLGLSADDSSGCAAFAERVLAWQRKALREAKLRSSWAAPDDAYEEACHDFLQRLMTGHEAVELRRALVHAVELAACNGALNSLSQCLLRMTAPGVPDLYQGCEYWDFSMVDPDNRRPVDYALREMSLRQSDPVTDLLRQWRDGHIKQWLITRVLNARRRQPELFRQGSYQPLTVHGRHADRLVAFCRRHGDQLAICIAPRLAAPLLGDSEVPLIPAQRWDDTLIDLPATYLTSVLTGEAVASGPAVLVSELLSAVPVNLLVTTQHQESTP
ncbi:maltooligosyl trehalose synthase [Halopseudomonas litoralis]|uniref:Maltooligosyl trehalose synthase n=1 Tax=Halopseudomonas litoralis TaxID=797277 RepID=A0A1H1T714_9GAMM|nr:malto-oligosyltrehalose synthase [Halopseudomonas litoralis]SDS56052.1 maltooligosyl trehalose synthase [Halopseudomonas litoralis]